MISKSIFDRFSKVALAVSGGKDSMVLLSEMARLFSHDFFYVINIEHGIRGEESREDSAFVEEYSKKLGIAVKRFDVDAIAYSKEHGYTLEQGARLLRREIFKREVDEGHADRVVVAHHLDDNIESIFMHILRGSGLRGLKGMDIDDGILLRPLLSTSREEIDEYITINNIPYREDSTNSDTAYRRNFLRCEVLPLLKYKYPTLGDNMTRLAKAVREDDEYLNDISKVHIRYDRGSVLVDTGIPDTLFKRCIYMAFAYLDVHADVEERHYDLLIDLERSKAGTTLDMPYLVKAVKEYDSIRLYREKAMSDSEVHLAMGDNVLDDYIVRIEEVDEMGSSEGEYKVLYLDKDSLEGAMLRHRRAGDTFHRYKGGNKKLKDYFIDIKLPKYERDIPVIAMEKEVLAVCGIEISEEVAVKDTTSTILKLTVRRCGK